jgi:uncharacterized protein (DUF1800 family)
LVGAAGLAAFAAGPPFETKLEKDRQILHALNRLTFGPQPGDIERVRQIGLKKWIEQQLYPERTGENPELLAKLQTLDTLGMNPPEILARYPSQPLIRQIADGKRPLPSDPFLRTAVENLTFELQTKKAKNKDDTQKDGEQPAEHADLSRLKNYLDDSQIQVLRKGAPEDKRKLLAGLPPETAQSAIIAMPKGMRNQLINVAPPDTRRKMMVLNFPQQAVTYDLWQGKVLRAIYSDHQLAEVLDDFWVNHFNVFVDKGPVRYMLAQYEREAIRPNVLGKFRDLLGATAKSQAMMFYLDNSESVGPHSEAAENEKRNAKRKQKQRGLNENYGRELLELHTLGVNGGYTQQDVIEVARCFSGWTVRQPNLGGGFFFNPKMHDRGEKTVLGQKIKAGGMEDGEQVLDILAKHPSTAHHIAYQLAQRFVADEPPPALVDRMAKTFLEKDGDIREVLKTMLDSPDFWTERVFMAKVKTPFEMAVSAVRILDADVDDVYSLTVRIGMLGEPLYRKQEPTGYSNVGSDWMNSAALLARLNFAMALIQNKLLGVQVDTTRLAPGEKSDPAQMAKAILLREPAPRTLDAIRGALEAQGNKSPADERQYLVGLIVGSPDFQRR